MDSTWQWAISQGIGVLIAIIVLLRLEPAMQNISKSLNEMGNRLGDMVNENRNLVDLIREGQRRLEQSERRTEDNQANIRRINEQHRGGDG